MTGTATGRRQAGARAMELELRFIGLVEDVIDAQAEVQVQDLGIADAPADPTVATVPSVRSGGGASPDAVNMNPSSQSRTSASISASARPGS